MKYSKFRGKKLNCVTEKKGYSCDKKKDHSSLVQLRECQFDYTAILIFTHPRQSANLREMRAGVFLVARVLFARLCVVFPPPNNQAQLKKGK